MRVCLSILLFCSLFISEAATIYVKHDAAGSNNGTSWANAYTSLQSALNAAVSSDEIWVAKGTYKPSSAYDLTNTSRFYHFRMINGVTIYGGFAGTETSVSQRTDFGFGGANETILSGDLNGDDVVSGSGSTLSLSNISENCYHVFYHPSALALTSTAVLDGFTIRGGNANESINNEVQGGGMLNKGCSPTIKNSTFTANYSIYLGGGLYNYSSSNPILTDVTFYKNQSGTYGGGMNNYTTSSPTLTNCTFSENRAIQGGACGFDGTTSIFTNVLFYGNYASTRGGAIVIVGPNVDLTMNNCTFSENSTGGTGGAVADVFSNANSDNVYNNCIFWGNSASTTGAEFNVSGPDHVLRYSCYNNQTGDVTVTSGSFTATDNNITTDPQFADTTSNDFRISGNSPAKNSGNNTYNASSFDVRGETRIQNTTIDMGAYEWTSGTDPDTPLPVELTSFTAAQVNGNVLLLWSTVTEVNNYGFEVERNSLRAGDNPDTDAWVTAGFVAGYGNSNSVKHYSYLDNTVAVGRYIYRLKQIDTDGKYSYSGVAEVQLGNQPDAYALEQNHPNPFNPSTMVQVSIPESGNVRLMIYNSLGAFVKEVVNRHFEAGNYSFTIDASDMNSGVYFYRLESGAFSSVKKMVVLK